MGDVWGPVIIAIIGAVGSVLGVVLQTNKAARDTDVKIAQAQAVFEAHVTEQISGIRADVSRLERKQDSHNQLIDRTYALEKASALHAEEQKRLGERLKILEGKGA